jgi:hypothetical protein
MTAKQIFKQVYKGGKNFMTPYVLSTSMKGKDCAVELSEGEGFDRNPIYGVTVVRLKDGEWTACYDESQCFHNKTLAQEYISQL